jgi:uncharacterized protein YndB with AHSA1/START domain
MDAKDPHRAIRAEAVVEAGVEEVWNAWTTEGGIKSFFAPDCHIEMKVDGLYEIFFDPGAEPGQRGADEMRILAIQPKTMLAFTWNAPLHLPEIRKQRTHVVLRFQEVAQGRTKMTLFHDGWGQGGEWDEAFEYFTRAWKEMVLPRLQYRFSVGPVDWEDPPKFKYSPNIKNL